jgi:ribosomal protein L44E
MIERKGEQGVPYSSNNNNNSKGRFSQRTVRHCTKNSIAVVISYRCERCHPRHTPMLIRSLNFLVVKMSYNL